MNKTNFVQTGGVPIKAERLQELQEAYSIFNHLGYLAGNRTIISGCTVVGTNVTDGVVVINGEVILFQGGTITANVIIAETSILKEFKDGTLKPLHYIRYATFGTSDQMIPWSDFKRIDPIVTLMTRLTSLEKKTAVFQTGGGMVLWNKPAAEIPEGWQEVINWRGRLPIGMDVTQSEFNLLGKNGGAKSQTLVNSNLPPLNFTMPGSNADNGDPGSRVVTASTEANAGFNVVVKAGAATSFEILNPYRTVIFIEFIG